MALRAKIAAKKREEELAKGGANPPAAAQPAADKPPATASAITAPAGAAASSVGAAGPSASGIRQGFLSSATLYPEGSSESAPALWRSAGAAANVFELVPGETEHLIRGSFRQAGHYLGKEDFAVTRNGLSLRIKGNPNDDPQSLVAGLDETVPLPLDTLPDGLSAEYADCTLTIRMPVNIELRELMLQLSPEEVQALAARLSQPEVQPGAQPEAQP